MSETCGIDSHAEDCMTGTAAHDVALLRDASIAMGQAYAAAGKRFTDAVSEGFRKAREARKPRLTTSSAEASEGPSGAVRCRTKPAKWQVQGAVPRRPAYAQPMNGELRFILNGVGAGALAAAMADLIVGRYLLAVPVLLVLGVMLLVAARRLA